MSCAISTFASATQLSRESLEQHGVTECRRKRIAAIELPCLDERGEVVGGVVCLAPPTIGTAGRWDRSDADVFLGAETFRGARASGEVILVESEIDALTLHEHGFSAVAVLAEPETDRWADALRDIDRVYVVVGRTCELPEFVSSMPEEDRARCWLVFLKDHASVNALHADPSLDFRSSWGQLVSAASVWPHHEEAVRAVRRAEARTACEDLVTDVSILSRFQAALRESGFAGDVGAALLLFLVAVSRLLPHPVSAVIKGPSAAGKSFLVRSVLRFAPESGYYTLTAMTEKAMIYANEPLRHRVLFIQEADGLGQTANLIVRSLLSEGRIEYSTVMSVDGKLQTVKIVREGPTSLIVTTTRVLLHRENETRVLSITVLDTPEQTQEVMRALAKDVVDPFSFHEWHALQEFLSASDTRVVLPFGEVLADVTEPIAVRMRRDFGTVLGLVRAHAFLQQERRERNEDGAIIATFEDYGAVRGLVEPVLEDGLEQTVTLEVRAVVEAVDLLHVPNDDDEGVTVAALANHLKLDRSSVHRRVAVALERDFLRDVGRGGRGRSKMLIPGEPLPDGTTQVLPTVADLEHLCTYACTPDLESPVEIEDAESADGKADPETEGLDDQGKGDEPLPF